MINLNSNNIFDINNFILYLIICHFLSFLLKHYLFYLFFSLIYFELYFFSFLPLLFIYLLFLLLFLLDFSFQIENNLFFFKLQLFIYFDGFFFYYHPFSFFLDSLTFNNYYIKLFYEIFKSLLELAVYAIILYFFFISL